MLIDRVRRSRRHLDSECRILNMRHNHLIRGDTQESLCDLLEALVIAELAEYECNCALMLNGPVVPFAQRHLQLIIEVVVTKLPKLTRTLQRERVQLPTCIKHPLA